MYKRQVLVAVAMGGLWLREHRKEAREAAAGQVQKEAAAAAEANRAAVAKWNEMNAAKNSAAAANAATATDANATPAPEGAAAKDAAAPKTCLLYTSSRFQGFKVARFQRFRAKAKATSTTPP